MILSTMGLMVILSFMLRSISTAGMYGLIRAELPLISVPVEDPTLTNYEPDSEGQIDEKTPVIILTRTEYIFGELRAFTSDLTNVRNKFIIPHVKGAPNIQELQVDIKKWIFARASKQKIGNPGFAILLPTDEIPSPIVIQTIHALKENSLFERIILSGGLK